MKRLTSLCVCLFTLAVIAFGCPRDGSAQQLVRFDSNLGKFDIQLTANTPLTNANFLTYVDAGSYTNSFIHRHAVNFVVQGGGFKFENDGFALTDQNDPVMNEPFNENVRGTVAMAKLGGDPDSATNQWFFNLEDNRANLDNQNGGFTAFANVIGDGMDVIDSMRDIPIFNASNITSAFNTLPLQNFANDGSPLMEENFILFNQVARVDDVLGDLDGSGNFTGADIDLLYAEYGTAAANDLNFDLDSSGTVDDADRDRLIERIALTRLGDTNFDGKVDVLTDASSLVNNLGVTSGATYQQGDLNGDGAVDVLNDGASLVNNLGFDRDAGTSGVSAAAVPEPTGSWLIVGLAVVSCLRRRR